MTSDALGRLTSVDEMLEYPSAGIYATTTYSFDVLDDLTGVTQGAQTPRTFDDSLKRLKQATNPESGTTNYTYDPNSNLFTKQDARLITTTYGYDALNRAQTRTYTNDPQFTPQVTYSYDAPLVPYSKGRLTHYLTSDHLGSTRVVTKTDGSVKSRYDYLPFGEALGSGIGQRTAPFEYVDPYG